MSGDDLAAFRRATVGFVFQHFGLLDALTALENVELAASLTGEARSARRGRATELLGRVGLGHRLGHRPHELSGGERQRVAIARALINAPRLVLADEPTGNLDEATAAEVVDLLVAVQAEHGCAMILVTHDQVLADRAEVRYGIRGGRVEAQG